MRKPAVCICKNNGADQLPGNIVITNFKLLLAKLQYEPRHEKTCLQGFRPGPTQTGLYCHCRLLRDLKFWIFDLFVLFDFLLYIHSKHLRSRQDGQLPHCSWASLPQAVYQYLVPILLPVTDNLLFLNQGKREIIFP